MKFRVIGSNRETGARMTLEFEAQSKAAAERKAQQSGMLVTRVEIFGEAAPEMSVRVVRPRGNRWVVRLIVLLGLSAGAFYWFHSRGFIR